MKKHLMLIAAAVAALVVVGCDKTNPTTGTGSGTGTNTGTNTGAGSGSGTGSGSGSGAGSGTTASIAADLTVTDIYDNCATISVKVTSGTASKAKIVKNVKYEDITINVSNDIQLISYIENNGVEVSLPYTETLTDLTVGKDFFTAVAVYNTSGRAEICKYQVWTPVGKVEGWSTENNPGSLDEVIWQ